LRRNKLADLHKTHFINRDLVQPLRLRCCQKDSLEFLLGHGFPPSLVGACPLEIRKHSNYPPGDTSSAPAKTCVCYPPTPLEVIRACENDLSPPPTASPICQTKSFSVEGRGANRCGSKYWKAFGSKSALLNPKTTKMVSDHSKWRPDPPR
jgi:hypothetical protein